MSSIHSSSQGFVRALKAATDPPTLGGPYKIEIARHSWDETSFYVPNKAEVIAEWILTKLLKEKANEPSINPILDIRFWILLHDVISSSDSALHGTNTRPLKAWLPTLLSRIPIAPILVSLLELAPSLDTEICCGLSDVISSCLAVIWPMAAQKTSVETMLECFGALVCAYKLCNADQGFARIGITVTTSFRNSLANSSNKKKIYTVFLRSHLDHWLQCVTLQNTQQPFLSLLDAFYDAGAETIFSLDILRQIRDSKEENTLLKAVGIAASSNNSILLVLPRLFFSYVEAIRRYRGALYSQGSNQLPGSVSEELCFSGMQFFAECEALLGHMDQNAQAWSTRAALLSLVDQERLFHEKQTSAELVLNHIINQALTALEEHQGERELTAYSVECLSALARIDYNIIIPALPRILPKLLTTRESTPAYVTFLDLVLAYHTKTRTMNEYLASLYTAFIPQAMVCSGAMRELYRIALSGPLFDAVHLEHLAKATQTFLAGTQVGHTVKSGLESLKEAWEHIDVAGGKCKMDEEEPRKKRRVMGLAGSNILRDSWAVTFALSAQISVTVLSSLPLHSVTEMARVELYCQLCDLQKLMHRIAKKAFKKMRGENSDNAWPLSVIATASLRLQYALDISDLTSPSVDAKLCDMMYVTLQDEALLPELSIEILRTLLHLAPFRDQAVTQAVLDHLLVFLENNFKTSHSSWSGRGHGLTLEKRGRRERALALMHMVVQRWLPLLESRASHEQLERFIHILMSVNVGDVKESATSSGLQTQSLLMQVLHSAHFWELPNIRTVFLVYLNQSIPVLDINDPDISESLICSTAASYRLLLMLPAEYLSRSSRIELIRKAICADCLITRLPENFSNKYECLTTLRVFLNRAFLHIRPGELTVQSLGNILSRLTVVEQPSPHAQQTYISATVNLIDSLFSALFKLPEGSGLATIMDWMCSYENIGLEIDQSRKANFHLLSITRMVKVLDAEYSLVNFPQDLQSAMLQLYQSLWMSISPRASALGMDSRTTSISLVQDHFLTLWCSLLMFGKWLGLKNSKTPQVGKRLTSKIIQLSKQSPPDRSDSWDEIRVITMAILLQELHNYQDESRLSHLDLILAAYISFSSFLGPNHRQQMDDYFSKACKVLSASEFTHVLEIISDSLVNITSPSQEICRHLIQLSAVLMREHPQGTLKPMQSFSSQAISIFAGWRWLINGPVELRVQTLELLVQHCAERPAVLRLVDMGSIWILLSRFLAGSCTHDDWSTFDIFHKIIAIISALVRLRRDLAVLTLPHLGRILGQLMMSLRSVRPHLGAKQTALVTDTQPRWINSKQPIGVEEAKALARLLETFTMKSMVRNHASSIETQKAESLAKPLSKHAAFVLKAYIDAMNDPLCLLSSEIRRELQRGLYVVCSIVSDHNRDAMMIAGLDAGGKSTMKTLWKEYEKQKYVGKG